jgi:transcription elongation GreA/GreB family factor
VVSADAIPRDVVTMNSRVRYVDETTGVIERTPLGRTHEESTS